MKYYLSLLAVLTCQLPAYAQVSDNTEAETAELFEQLELLENELVTLKQENVVPPAPEVLRSVPQTQAAVEFPLPTGSVLEVPVIQPPQPQTPVVTMVPNVPFRMEMVRINPGLYVMGSNDFEERRERTEGPRQSVNIAYAFEVGKYEVTFDQWDACVKSGGCNQYRPLDGDWGRGTRPVINVSWDDAQSFIAWLNTVTGHEYRLLSEAEWEYVARAGTDTPFYTGDIITSKQANINGKKTYQGSPIGVYLRKTVKVGSYEPNAFGLHDLLGNAFEWTQDCWHESHMGAPNDGRAREDGNCKFRVMKGGSWVSHPDQVRVAARTQYVPNFRYDDYGFRIARTLEPSPEATIPPPSPLYVGVPHIP